MAETIKGIILSDGTVLEASVLGYVTLSSKGNLQITSPEGGKVNIESSDNIALKPFGNLQHDTAHYAPDEDKSEFKMKAICDSKDKVEGYNIEAAGVKFITKKADPAFWDCKKWILKIQESATKYAKGIINAASWDIRTRSTGRGTGGGIALQISSTDSDGKENKLKIETDRIVDVNASAIPPSATSFDGSSYTGEGGKGIEIGTINSQMTSLFTNTYRFFGNGRVYGVTRGAITKDEATGKYDYPTQQDDSKDILPSTSVTWNEIINAVLYLKSQGHI